jgi:hypothetical protein
VLLPDFWRQHAIIAGLVSGLALLLLGLAVVDSFIESRESRRWQTAAKVGFKSLARSVEEALDDLSFAFSGTRPPYAAYSPPWDEAFSLRLAAETDGAGGGVLPITEAVMGDLLRNAQRRDLVEEALVTIRLRHRERLAVWMPTFVFVPRLAGVAEQLALFNEKLGAVQGPLAEVRSADPEVGTEPDRAAAAHLALSDAVSTGIACQNKLMHDAGADWFRTPARHRELLATPQEANREHDPPS